MTAHPVDIHVGARLRARRKIIGLSQDDIGKSVGVTFQQIQKYERGTNRIGSSRLYEFSRILDVPVSYFFENFSFTTADMDSDKAVDISPANSKFDMTSKETMVLVQSYYKIADPVVRTKMLNLIKALKTKDDEGSVNL